MNTGIHLSPTSRKLRRALGALSVTALSLLAAPTAEAQTVYGLSQNGNVLVTFTSASLVSGVAPTFTPITGVAAGQTLVGLDSRPATGQLFAFGYDFAGTAQLYVINQANGAATTVGGTITLPLGGPGERIGFDFNPTVDRIRVTSSNDANYRLNPNNGAIAATDLALQFAAPATGNPVVGAVAYTNSFLGAASTTLYDIDESRSTLYIQNPPNNGTLTAGVTIRTGAGLTPLLTSSDQTDFDIYTDPASRAQSTLLAVTTSVATSFYSLDLATGNASLLNGGTAGLFISDIAFGIDRTMPAQSGQLLYALNTNNALLSFYSGTPQFINSAVALSGVTAGQTIVGTDFRPNTGQLIAMGYDPSTTGANSQFYIVNTATGALTSLGAAVRLELGTSLNGIGFDFNPTVDRIRVTSSNRANYRINPNNAGGTPTLDGSLVFVDGTSGTPNIGAVAYTNSYPGSTSTTLYDLDETLNRLFIQSNPNAGQLSAVSTNPVLPGASTVNDLDIYFDAGTQTNTAFLVSDVAAGGGAQNYSTLYTLNLGTGQSSATGVIGLGGIAVRDVAAQLSGPNASAQLSGRLLYGLAGSNLVSFDSSNPTVIRTAVNITGLPAAQALAGLDFRPLDGQLYAFGYDATNQQGQLYTLNISTGALTAVGGLNPYALGSSASGIGFDFNPVPDRIRIVGASGSNYRIDPSNGSGFATPDGSTGRSLAGAAYTNNDNNAATATSLYGYDQSTNEVVLFTSPNAGTNSTLGSSTISVNAASGVDFDIYFDPTAPSATQNTAFLVAAPSGTTADNLYTVNLGSGAATLVGRVGSGSNLSGLAAFLTPGPVITAGLTWTGAVSTDWGTAGNWSPAQVPTATDNVIIPDVANDPVVSNVQQANAIVLANGATLTTANGGILTVNGNFLNNGGTTLGSGTGTMAFAGAAAQTISGTTTFFNNLTAGPAGLTASAPVQVQLVLLLNGNLASGGNLTLLSNATGTAHVVNSGGAVTGTATVQRYIDPSLNPGPGYRHYSAPVSGSTVADLATANFAPVVNPAYNTQGNTVTPFPTVFGYDETRVNTSGSPAPQDFDKGYFSPGTLGDALEVGRGYTVNIPGTEKVDFVGTLNNGPITRSNLSRGTQTESGWQLLGNPYPSPINFDQVGLSNVDASLYVFRSTGQYAGTYSSYVNGVGTNGGSNLLPSSQGFFVRVSTPGTANGQVSFSNAARLTTYASPVFQRNANTAPLVRLDLRGTTGTADEALVYFDAAASAGFDATLDAHKLLAPGTVPQLATETGAAAPLAINALPALGAADVVVNLRVQAPQAGSYTLRAAELQRLPAGTFAYLRDALTGTVTDLAVQPSYRFTTAAGAPATGRFSLVFSQRQALATASASLTQQVAVYPNPARGQVSIALPSQLTKQAVELTLVNTLGQVVLQQTLPATRTADAQALSLAGVAKGVYTLRLQTTEGTVNKRLVVE